MAPVQVPARHRFSTGEWHRMGEAGLFGEDDRLELLDGEVLTMSPIGPRHAVCVDRLSRLLWQQVGDRAVVRVQNPVGLGRYSEPQPDLALTRPPADAYLRAHPGPSDLLLVVEVADTTFEWDRVHKATLYAGAGVVETWVVDLGGDQVVVLTEPAGGGYRRERLARRGDVVEPVALPGLVLGAAQILG